MLRYPADLGVFCKGEMLVVAHAKVDKVRVRQCNTLPLVMVGHRFVYAHQADDGSFTLKR